MWFLAQAMFAHVDINMADLMEVKSRGIWILTERWRKFSPSAIGCTLDIHPLKCLFDVHTLGACDNDGELTRPVEKKIMA